VEAILRDEEWARWPQTKIAEHVGCVHSFISKVKMEMNLVTGDKVERSSTVTITDKRGRTYEMDTSNIGLR
jgi:hypothetical protein